ncbi:hypothetical protein PC115_g15754 [Phytophthora cactorum]|uniref:Ubiquitin-like-conjugating enzyme ATG10 n=1 Tax=Phytophthora cactorum TaxID=29920 RepID=A0A8T1BEB1_9STRA|nr:hypothetical protein PC115_g15754 [Phytophthora cactorum]
MGLEEMRDGSISNERFCMEADLLQKWSHELASKQAVGCGKCVATWEWRHGNRQHLDGNSYLVSTGNVRQYRSDAGADSVTTTKELGGDIDELLLDEEDNWMGDNEAQTTVLQSGDVETALLEFHIIYHTIFQTPVLYFRALAVDGTPLNTNAVTRDVQFPGSNGRSTFVAMEEHPVLGKPFSFLHPCETAAAMQLLQAQLQSSSTAEVSPDSEVPQYLTSWLSLRHFSSSEKAQMAEDAARPRKKQRVGGVPPPATASTRAKFAFGSRLPDTVNPRKRRRPISQDEDEMTSDAKTSHRPVTVKTALPRQGSRLPAPTKVPDLVSGSHLHTKSPSNLAIRHKKQESTEQRELVADMAATEPEFWITRRKMVEAALEELDAIEHRLVPSRSHSRAFRVCSSSSSTR